jgi:D-aminoacyl-tRNA deacylase
MILVVASTRDVASLNIKAQVLCNYDFTEETEKFDSNPRYKAKINDNDVELITLNSESIYSQNLPESFKDLKLVIFISRHSSISGKPTLSVHTPGNLAEAELGGIPRAVSVCPANSMRTALITMFKLKNEMQLDYEVSYECTHHGPSFNLPAMFVELGSSLQQWSDLKAAEAVAHSAIEAVKTFGNHSTRTVMGIGGPHYSAKFTRMALEGNVAFGHMIPKYAVSKMDPSMIRQCAQRTVEKVDTVMLDWKGIRGEDKPRLVETLKEADVKFEKA